MDQLPETKTEKMHRVSQRLQKTAMFVMSFMVVLSFMMTNLLAILWQSSDWLVGAVLPGVVASLTNEEREKYSLAPLSRSATLDAAATMKAEHMAAEEYFSHDSPGGITPWYWFEEAGYVYAHAGENLAIHFQDSDEVVKAWMNSPTHKANVVGSQYTEIGIGTAKGTYQGYDTVFVVQLFGTPAKRPVVVAPPVSVAAEQEKEEASLTIVTTETLAIAQTEDWQEESDEVVTTPVKIESEVETEEDLSNEAGTPAESVSEETYGIDENLAMVEGDYETASDPSALEIASAEDYVSASFVATSSGLLPYLEGKEFVAGTTAPTISTLATQPRTVLQGIYMLIGGIVLVLLVSSIVLGYRTHHVRTVLTGVGLLMLMSLLFVWHIAITGGAVVV